MAELSGSLSEMLGRIKAEGLARNRVAFEAWVNFLDARANAHVREGGSHRRGTPTPATKGRGPAVVSGDLSRSVRQTPIKEIGTKLEARVGPAEVPHQRARVKRARGGRSSAPSAGQVGEYVEKMGYEFMKPSAEEAEREAARFWLDKFAGM